MPTFGIVSEGYTDQVLLEGILEGFFKGQSATAEVKYLSPVLDTTDSATANKAGWFQVFEYCKHPENFARDLQYNDFIIIQIDTDVSEETHYEISKTNVDGVAYTPTELVKLVIEKFVSLIDPGLMEKFSDKIIFAISVHSIECWLLPELGSTASDQKKIVNCIGTLNSRIITKLGFTIDPSNKSHNDNYETFAGIFAKKKRTELLTLAKKNESFDIFLSHLNDLCPIN